MSRAYFLTICVIIFQHAGRVFIRCYAFHTHIYIYIYDIAVLIIICRFLINVDVKICKRHIIIRTDILYNEINSGQIMKNTK